MSTAPAPVTEKEIVNNRALITTANRNYRTLLRQIDTLTHEESLLQPPFRGNCLNWVMGHIVQSRDRMLRLVGEATLWTPEQVARYERDSEPVLADAPDVLRFEKIVADLGTQNQRLVARLETMTQDDLDTIGIEAIKGITDWTIGEWLHFLLWHETYHLGTTEQLRQLAGRNDKVI